MAAPDHNRAPVGVILVNLGTPDAPTLPAVRRYLREFLSDRRIVDLNPVLWRVILETSIMHRHAARSTAKYASVWRDDGSPLLVHTRALTQALAGALGAAFTEPEALESVAAAPDPPAALGAASDPAGTPAPPPGHDQADVVVTYAMRYGQPALAGLLAGLERRGLRRLLLMPLYPQFSTTTTAPVIDALTGYLGRSNNQPEVRWIRSWPVDPAYIEACARQIEGHWATAGRPDFARGDKLLLSYHGLPLGHVEAGDPYPTECQDTTDALRDRLRLGPEHCLMTYQSKFGRGRWLTPATIDTVGKLGELGTPRLDVFCPGFATDCLETLEEIDLLNRDAFLSHGGGEFHLIAGLNSAPAWVEALAGLVRRHTAGW